ncbi:MAG: hypothetical protein ACRDOT_09305 [Aeromicrobium sp.]
MRKEAKAEARRQRKEARAAARRQREEAQATARKEKEVAQAAARREREEALATARKEKEEAQAAARREREEAQAAARKEREEAQAAARKAKEQAETAARELREEEAKSRRAADDVADRAKRDRPDTQALATAPAAASATARVEPDQPEAGDDVDGGPEIAIHSAREAARAAAETDRSKPKEDERQIRADAKAARQSDAEERKAARAAAAEEKMRAKKEARKHRADAKEQAKDAKAQAKRDAKEAKLEAKSGPKEHNEDARATQAEKADAEFLKSLREDMPPAAAVGGHAAAVPTSERALVEAADAAETTEVETAEEPSSTTISRDAGAHRQPRPEATQPIGRVQVDDVPDTVPKKERTGVRAAAIMVAALVGALGLIFSVVLAVGALTVAIGAGEGNAIYDPLSTVCDALVGPLKNAFNFTGPNAASREEFLGWGAGSLIYLAVSFAGQAAHRAATRD